MFDTYVRPPLRKLLLRLLQWTETAPGQSPVRRIGQRFWQREIQVPSLTVAVLSFAVFFIILLFEVGLSWLKILGLALFLVIIFVYLMLYLRAEHPKLLADSEAMMLLGLIFISAALLMQLSKEWFSPLATPLATFTLLTGLLLSRSLALMVGIILSLLLGVLNDFSLENLVVHLFGALTVVALLPGIRNRADLTRVGLRLVLVNALAILMIHLFRQWPLKTLEFNLFWGVLSGFVSVLLVLGTLPYLEVFFSRTTNIKLLELADFNQPILKRLMMEAPGTYHHSLIMASLAEQAAEAIGANSLLARVGAYYHDIGKLSNPDYFIENQQPNANPHDPLAPTMSSLVVISHVKEGAALAQKHGIDRVIIDCVEQHHGTSLIHYFYHRALQQNSGIQSDNFRYPGPKPQRKETAILMLADAVEAACRTIEAPSPGRLKDTVEKVINNKFTDGQFSECPITLHDLSSIAESMVVTLSGIYHARIEYQGTNGNKD
ncbi:MAG: HD family phosphohydrolase [Endomicrobiales bacterium]